MTRKFSEYVSPGHPDKCADYISEYILDRYLEKDPNVRYAVEVMIKGNMVHIAGEVTSPVYFGYTEYVEFVKEQIMTFVVNMTDEYKRVYELGSRYPDIALVLIRQMFSNAVYNNRKYVAFKDIYDAVRFTKVVYPDVIKKELVIFKDTFKEELEYENINVDPDNYLNN